MSNTDTQVDTYRWVKASERLPEIKVVVLVNKFGSYEECYYNGHWFIKGTNIVRYDNYHNSYIEWLEQIPTTQPKNPTDEDIECKCPNEIKTGQTSIMCCNICGKPDEAFWRKGK